MGGKWLDLASVARKLSIYKPHMRSMVDFVLIVLNLRFVIFHMTLHVWGFFSSRANVGQYFMEHVGKGMRITREHESQLIANVDFFFRRDFWSLSGYGLSIKSGG